MPKMLAIELSRAFKNKFFLYGLLLGASITLWHFFQYVLPAGLGLDQAVPYLLEHDPMYTPGRLFSIWIGDNPWAVQSFLYYLLLPIIAVIPYADSFFYERKSGFTKNVFVRTKKSNYYRAKYIAVFVVAGMTAVVPLLLNLALSALFIPAMLPQVATRFFAIDARSLWNEIFITYPFVYVFLYMIITYLFAGLLATISLVVSFFVEYRFIVVIAPFLLYMFAFSLLDFFDDFGHLQPINFLSPSFGNSSLLIIGGWLILLALATLPLFLWKGAKNDTF